jgi:hypothetical protein
MQERDRLLKEKKFSTGKGSPKKLRELFEEKDKSRKLEEKLQE